MGGCPPVCKFYGSVEIATNPSYCEAVHTPVQSCFTCSGDAINDYQYSLKFDSLTIEFFQKQIFLDSTSDKRFLNLICRRWNMWRNNIPKPSTKLFKWSNTVPFICWYSRKEIEVNYDNATEKHLYNTILHFSRLTFTAFNTESCCDKVTVYDGSHTVKRT